MIFRDQNLVPLVDEYWCVTAIKSYTYFTQWIIFHYYHYRDLAVALL